MLGDLTSVRLNLPPVGKEKGGFFVQNDEDAASFDFNGYAPEFWIVRYSPKADPEVWPTEKGASTDGTGEEPGQTSAEPVDPVFDPIFDRAPSEAEPSEDAAPFEGPF